MPILRSLTSLVKELCIALLQFGNWKIRGVPAALPPPPAMRRAPTALALFFSLLKIEEATTTVPGPGACVHGAASFVNFTFPHTTGTQ